MSNCMDFKRGEIVSYCGSYFRIYMEKNIEEVYITTAYNSTSIWVAEKKNIIKLDTQQQHITKLSIAGNYIIL